MDLPLRSRLLGSFVSAIVLFGIFTIFSGSFLINRMVISEAQRRIDLALKTADAMLERRLEEVRKSCLMISGAHMAEKLEYKTRIDQASLVDLLHKSGYDFLHVLDTKGAVIATARGFAGGSNFSGNEVVKAAMANRASVAGISLVPMRDIQLEDKDLVKKAMVPILPTPHAKPGGPGQLTEAMVLEASAPIFGPDRRIVGYAHLGSVLNQNFDFVDFVRENIFTVATYQGKNLGTVTIFQGDVRITTNVIGPNKQRAIGTRVSEEVNDQVLGAGKTWTGPAFVVDAWYISAYEPLRDINDQIVGMLYVGVLKKRYDDMRNQALVLFIMVAVISLVSVVFLSFWLARRLSRPLTRLTDATTEVSRGNFSDQLPDPPSARHDEINRLTSAFNRMVSALRERDAELKRSRDNLQITADQLKKSVTHYLETLEFITHELKNQIASMKINLLAVKDGYIGPITDAQQEALNDVNHSIIRAEEMTLNYLNLSRIEKGELQVKMRNVHVDSDIIRPVVNNLRGRLERKHLQVETRIDEDLFVRADSSLLQIVYENLVSNAAKYGREGGRIRLSGFRSGNMAELHVWNDGPGVPADQMSKLFEKFFRIPQPSEEERGTGLGLFISREILHRQGGEIAVNGVYGEWIDFVFTLALPKDAAGSGPPDR